MDELVRNIKKIIVGNNVLFTSKIWYFIKFNRLLNLKDPKLFSDKIQYLKLVTYPESAQIGKLSDKVGVRDYLDYLELNKLKTPLIGVYDSIHEIDWEKLPESFVAKKSNAAGYNIIVKNKKNADEKLFKRKMNRFLLSDYGSQSGERHYKLGLNKIIIEPFLELTADYKFFCFNGDVLFCGVYTRYFKEENIVAGRGEFKREWKIIADNKILNDNLFPKFHGKLPDKFEEMIQQAETLSKQFPFVRVDFYEVNGHLLLSELTFTPSNGFNTYFNIDVQKELGNKIDLGLQGITN